MPVTTVWLQQLNILQTNWIVVSVKRQYDQSGAPEGVQKQRTKDGDVVALPLKKCGRPLLLGEELDTKMQLYPKKVRDSGGVVSAQTAIAAARGHCTKCASLQSLEGM